MSSNIIQLNKNLIKALNIPPYVTRLMKQLKITTTAKYERMSNRNGYRSAYYNRNLYPTSRYVSPKVPDLKRISFETTIIERYRHLETNFEEDFIKNIYLSEVSIRHV